MDIHALRELLLDLDCMTALRPVMENPGISALYALLRACAQDQADPEALTGAYCAAYDAWRTAATMGRGAFARLALEAAVSHASYAAQYAPVSASGSA